MVRPWFLTSLLLLLGVGLWSSFDHGLLDVMRGYEESIKVIYNAIVAFSTRVRVRGSLTPMQQEEIDSIRVLCRLIAEVIHDISNMRDNLDLYLNSSNRHITRQYDLIRLRIATILRDIYSIRASKDEAMMTRTLDGFSEDLLQADVLANGTLHRLVRDNLITDRMPTSLMNDSSYASHITTNLIEITRRMFTMQGSGSKGGGNSAHGNEKEPSAYAEGSKK